jgi:hypothetical protein
VGRRKPQGQKGRQFLPRPVPGLRPGFVYRHGEFPPRPGGPLFLYFSQPEHLALCPEPPQLPSEMGPRPAITPMDMMNTTKRIRVNVINKVAMIHPY